MGADDDAGAGPARTAARDPVSAALVAPAATLGAIGLLLAGVFLLSVMGVLVKLLSDRYSPAELAAWRNLIGMAPTAALLLFASDWRARGRPLRLRAWKLALLRGGFVTGAQFCYYVALSQLEFATVATLTFTGPLFVTALSAIVLRADVGPWRWGAVATGFVGVIFIMRPGADAFTLAAVLPLGAALGYASSSVAAPLLDREAPTALINLYSAVSALLGALLLALATGGMTGPASAADLWTILAMGGSGGLGVLCLVAAYRLATPSVISPFEYFGILFAIVLGWAVFGEAPLDRLFPGALLIAGAGIVIAWREGRRRRARPAAP